MPNRISLEAILSIVPDAAKAQQLKQMMDTQEQSWGRIEQTVGRISDSVEGIVRFGLGAAGVAGISQLASNFFNTSQMGSNVGLAAGRVTGGAGVWHPYSQGLLSAQAKTGVSAQEIGQGLIQALQSVGGNPTPNQAAILGGLLAGYGQTAGLTPSQVAQVVAPLLQAANKPLTGANVLGIAATLSGGLSNAPGSQAAPLMGLLSNLGVQQALGSGPAGGFTSGLTGLTTAVNTAIGGNSIWRNPSITGGAINSISGGLQNAYSNPSLQAFMQMAGISYEDQRKGFTPQNMQAIMSEATKVYGTGNARDVFLRSIFGLQGADLLEQFAPGTKDAHQLQQALAHPPDHQQQTQHLQHQISGAQARTTPNAQANRLGGDILKFLETPGGAAAGLAGLLGVRSLAKRAPSIISKALGGGGDSAAGDAASAGEKGLLWGLRIDPLTAGLTTAATLLADPASAGGPARSGNNAGPALQLALKQTLGHHFDSSTQAEKYLRSSFAGDVRSRELLGGGTQKSGNDLLDKFFDALKSRTGGDDPIATFDQAAKMLLQAVNKMGSGRKDASYQVGSVGAQYASLGTPAMSMLGQTAPSLEFASLELGTASASSGSVPATYSSGSHSAFVSYAPSGAAGGGTPAMGGRAVGGALQKFSAAQRTFATTLAQRTGMNLNVILAWMSAEQPPGSASAPNGRNNWLNIGATDSGYFGGQNPAWSDPVSAAIETAKWLSGSPIGSGTDSPTGYGTASSGVQGILGAAGQSGGAQVQAIQGSGWASSGYPLLGQDYSSILNAGGARIAHRAAHHAPHHRKPHVAAGGSSHAAYVHHEQPIHVHVHIDGKKQRAQRVLAGHSPTSIA